MKTHAKLTFINICMTPTWWVTKIKINEMLTLSNNEKVELTWKLTICYEENKE